VPITTLELGLFIEQNKQRFAVHICFIWTLVTHEELMNDKASLVRFMNIHEQRKECSKNRHSTKKAKTPGAGGNNSLFETLPTQYFMSTLRSQ
jgi:hypothetical protein